MEIITDFDQIHSLNENKIIFSGNNAAALLSSKISFSGKNNILFIDNDAKHVTISNSNINFCGSNAVLFISGSSRNYMLDLSINNETAIYFGGDSYFNGCFKATTSEHQNIIVGNDGLFSFGIFIRTADPHLIYDCETKKRVNNSKSVLISDHVWIGQSVLILKGSTVGSGSIIAANSVLSGKTIPSNTCVAGNPAKIVKENVFFSKECTHAWSEDDTKAFEYMNKDDFVYQKDDTTISLFDIDLELKAQACPDAKLEILKKLAKNTSKNRFFIEKEVKPRKGFFARLFKK